MSNSEAKLHLSLEAGIFEISGSEDFVSKQIENFKEIIQTSLENRNFDSNNLNNSLTDHHPIDSLSESKSSENSSFENNYPKILHIEEESVKILKKIPGSTNSKKTVNTALVCLWAMKKIGIQSVSAEEIRDQCEEQSCLDTNFATNLKKAKEFIIVDGSKGSNLNKYKLTLPGVEQAEILLEEMNGA